MKNKNVSLWKNDVPFYNEEYGNFKPELVD